MIDAANLEASINLPQLFRKKLSSPKSGSLMQSYFSKRVRTVENWLLDRKQQDENARVEIGMLALDQGQIGYDDPQQKTHIESKVSTHATADSSDIGVDFSANGHIHGLALNAHGNGGAVLCPTRR